MIRNARRVKLEQADLEQRRHDAVAIPEWLVEKGTQRIAQPKVMAQRAVREHANEGVVATVDLLERGIE